LTVERIICVYDTRPIVLNYICVLYVYDWNHGSCVVW